MRTEAFNGWLQGKISSWPIFDCIGNCLIIEDRLKLNLDEEFKKDGGRRLMYLLEYTIEDERLGIPAPLGLYFSPGENVRKGMESICSAIRKYFKFCRLYD